MKYRDLMEPYPEKNIINWDAPISIAVNMMKQKDLPLLIVRGEEEKLGILSKNNLLDAYLGEVSVNKPLSHLITERTVITDEEGEVDKNLFKDTEHIIVTNGKGAVTGIITPEAIPQATMKNAIERMKSEIATKKSSIRRKTSSIGKTHIFGIANTLISWSGLQN